MIAEGKEQLEAALEEGKAAAAKTKKELQEKLAAARAARIPPPSGTWPVRIRAMPGPASVAGSRDARLAEGTGPCRGSCGVSCTVGVMERCHDPHFGL